MRQMVSKHPNKKQWLVVFSVRQSKKQQYYPAIKQWNTCREKEKKQITSKCKNKLRCDAQGNKIKRPLF